MTKEPERVDRGQLVASRQRNDQRAMNHGWRGRQHDQAVVRSPHERGDSALDGGRVACVERANLDPQRCGRGLQCAELTKPGGLRGLVENRRTSHARRDLFEKFDPFRAYAELPLGKSSGVAARPRQTGDVARADRIGDQKEHDRHRAACLLQRPHDRAADRQDDLGRELCPTLGTTSRYGMRDWKCRRNKKPRQKPGFSLRCRAEAY